MNKLKDFYKPLRELGFTRSSAGDPIIYERHMNGGRLVSVQLWRDGKHRASHRINGHGTTLPSDFQTVSEMLGAVRRESSRIDNKYYGVPAATMRKATCAIFKGMKRGQCSIPMENMKRFDEIVRAAKSAR